MNKVIGKIATAITCLMMAAVCCIPAATRFVGAAEAGHAHVYADGRCACGSALFEAEDADLGGSVPSGDNTTNLGSNPAASGGGLVNNWSVAGNEIVWTFSVDKSVTASVELVMSPCEEATTFSSTLALTVNGSPVAMKDDNIRGIDGEQWHNYSAFETQDVAFAKGDVRVVLRAKRAYNVNIDCLRVNFSAADDVAVGAFNKLSASGHTHFFSAGKCECGALIFEAEDGEIAGTPTFDNPDFAGKSKAAHGGRLVGNWGNGDNILTWTLNGEKAVTGAKIDLVIASCTDDGSYALPTEASQTDGAIMWPFELRTERAEGDLTVKNTIYWENSGLETMPTDNWHDYRVYSTKPFDLAMGENKIKIEAYNGYPMNIDYIVVSFPTSTEPDEPVEPEHTHAFAEGVCDCGAVKLEAEHADVSGTPTGSDSFLEASDKASGGWCVAGWSEGDNLLKFTFDVSAACESVRIGFTFAPCGDIGVEYTLPTTEAAAWDNKGNAFWPFLLRVGGVGQGFTTTDVPDYAGDGNYYDWHTVYTNPVDLAQGENVVEIEACDYYAMNLDYIFLEVPPDVTVTTERLDNAEPTIGTIAVTPDAPKAGGEVAFSFEVTDNVTAADKLNVSVKVYLNYGKPTQREIACAGNIFTPAEAGKYTIVVEATDEAGLSAQKLRAVTVTEADPPAPEQPGGDEGPAPGGDTPIAEGCSGCGSLAGGLLPAIIIALSLLLCGVVRILVKKRR